MTSASDPLYVAARQVLLDALSVLQPHLDAIVVVGAQAVYLRTEELRLPVAPYTTDSDLVLDPSVLASEPDLFTALERGGFELARDRDGNVQPGAWITTRTVDGKDTAIPVDLIVPTGVSGTRRRSARLPGHTTGAARTIPGLEAAVLDHSPWTVNALEPRDPRTFRVQVAGPVALLIAKAFKIQERLSRPSRPDRVHEKDAGDVYRLMQASDVATCVEVADGLRRHDALGEICTDGLRHLVQLFQGTRTPGTAMAVEHFRTGLPAERVTDVVTTFARALRRSLEES
ncbi:MAG TPA: hypothetical protein VG318_01035 [Actinomycetota bacterium]|nr:hypothetical protein [Actinomycetota bacterium]